MRARPATLLATAILAATATATATAQTPLIGHWTFDESSGLVANDSGPFGNHGALTNVLASQTPWVPGMHGNAIALDGVDDYVSFALNGGLPLYEGMGNAFSVCFWVKAGAQNDDRVLSIDSTQNNNALFTLGSGGTGLEDKLRLFIRNDAGSTIASSYSDATVFDDVWHHIVYVDVAGSARVYVDGVPDKTIFDYRYGYRGPRSTLYGTFTVDQVNLGSVVRSAPCCHLTAEIDDLRIYGFALQEADVKTVLNNGPLTVCRGSIGEYGVACGPGPLELLGAGSPQVGGSGLLFAMRNGRAGAGSFLCFGSGQVSPLSLDPLGLVGCTLYAANPTCMTTGPLSAYGSSGVIAIAVPNVGALTCSQFVFQATTFDPVSASLDLSNAALVQLGM